eukprot:scaffold34600_cov184-Amphora_coffeaeformis.AAC.3
MSFPQIYIIVGVLAPVRVTAFVRRLNDESISCRSTKFNGLLFIETSCTLPPRHKTKGDLTNQPTKTQTKEQHQIMTRSLATLSTFLLVLLAETHALVPRTTTTTAKNVQQQQQQQQHQDRRAFFQGLIGSAVVGTALLTNSLAAQATVAQTGAASPWTGFYDDPNHAGCLRQVKVVGAPMRPNGTPSPFPIVEVRGYDGPEGTAVCTEPPAKRDAIWTVKGPLKGNSVVLDFSSKGGPSDLKAEYQDGGIVFPDGNKWTKVILGTPDRLPKDMSTLKSN